eukprot:TRINITY_DN20735_c0_g1_i1.p1 TRINITY_DN20735_c0_g1~~TRINITY_DN20735_c0_g1_i1.p1  ORF type:complete len:411 (+),score=31.87 TRINITY_DN20735_c0_g1_i1:157-1389(+)
MASRSGVNVKLSLSHGFASQKAAVEAEARGDEIQLKPSSKNYRSKADEQGSHWSASFDLLLKAIEHFHAVAKASNALPDEKDLASERMATLMARAEALQRKRRTITKPADAPPSWIADGFAAEPIFTVYEDSKLRSGEAGVANLRLDCGATYELEVRNLSSPGLSGSMVSVAAALHDTRAHEFQVGLHPLSMCSWRFTTPGFDAVQRAAVAAAAAAAAAEERHRVLAGPKAAPAPPPPVVPVSPTGACQFTLRLTTDALLISTPVRALVVRLLQRESHAGSQDISVFPSAGRVPPPVPVAPSTFGATNDQQSSIGRHEASHEAGLAVPVPLRDVPEQPVPTDREPEPEAMPSHVATAGLRLDDLARLLPSAPTHPIVPRPAILTSASTGGFLSGISADALRLDEQGEGGD